MRGTFRDQGSMFSYVLPEQRIPAEHPLRPIRELVRDRNGSCQRTQLRPVATELIDNSPASSGRPIVFGLDQLRPRSGAPGRLWN